ncbi:MAG: exo-alpha-sialidase [Euryarchaeota archaeon]|nr:exo-alpha-sialidase [Euryarchaeota archaeon]
MGKNVRGLSTLAIVLPLLGVSLAGCVSPTSSMTPTDTSLPVNLAPVVEAVGAQISVVGDSVVLVWSGKVTPPAAIWRPDTGPTPVPLPVPIPSSVSKPRLPDDPLNYVDLDFTLPPDVTIVQGNLTWMDGAATLGFRVLNESGTTWCGAPSIGRNARAGECWATLYGDRSEVRDWRLRVSAISRIGDAVPVDFAARLTLRNVTLPILGSPVPVGTQAPLQFGTPVLVDAEKRTGEPSIAVSPKGTIYVAAPTGPQESLWQSMDGGMSFTRIKIHHDVRSDQMGALSDPGSIYTVGGGDSDVAVTGEDTIYFSDQQGGSGETVSSSHDGGKTWFTNPGGAQYPAQPNPASFYPVSPPALPVAAPGLPIGAPYSADRQWLVVDGADHVWLGFNGRDGATVTHSFDGGKTFSGRTIIPEDDCFRGNLARAPDGTLYLAGCNDDGPGVATSTDMGKTFVWHNVAKRNGETNTSFCFPCHIFTVVTADAGGNVYTAWSDETDSNGGLSIWISHSSDKGATWSPPQKVNNNPGTYLLPWLTAGAAGKVALSFYGTAFVGHPEKVLGEWYTILAITENGLDDDATWVESAASPELIQYGPVCMRGSACGNARNLLDFFQIQADKDGLIHMAYVDGSAGGTARLSKIMYVRQTGGLSLGGPSVDKNGGK